MPTSDSEGGRTASAQMFQDAFASYLLMLCDLPDREVVTVAKSAAKDLVVTIANREPAEEVRAALVEISTLCQHELLSAERRSEVDRLDC
ncbi:MAG: hypothetical protein AAF557_13880 [Pseudomonadota bacterium]